MKLLSEAQEEPERNKMDVISLDIDLETRLYTVYYTELGKKQNKKTKKTNTCIQF